MAQTIKLRRSGTSGAIPTTSQLELGEVAINTYDGKMYVKKNVGGTESIVEIGSGSDGVYEEYIFTATNAQTTFTGSDDNSLTLSYVSGAVQVFLNGVLLDPGTDFTATNGTSLVLTSAAATNDLLQIFAFKKKISDGSVTVNTFSGNNSTTAFTLSLDPGDENNTRVFIDGVYQSKSNYSVSGTTLTFSSAPPTGTAIEVEIGNRNVTLDTTANLDLPDNVKLRLGTSQDADFYHDGTDTYLRNQTGQLLIRGNDTKLQSYLGETYATFANNGAVTLYYDNSAKIATTSSGATVTGTLTTTGTGGGSASLGSHLDLGDSQKVRLGASDDLQLFHDGSHSYIDDAGTGNLYIRNGTKNSIFARTDGEVILYHNDANKLATTSTGVSVTGNIVTDGEIRGPATFVIDPAAVGDNTGTVQIKGNLQVDGSTTTINSTTLTVDDLNITLASGAANATAANGAGITIDGASATLTYASSGDTWDFNKSIIIPEKIVHAGDTDTFFRFAGANDIRIVAGNVEHAAFDGTIVFNQSGADMDLRVESSGNQNMLMVDAGNDRVAIGHNAPTAVLDVRIPGTSGKIAEFHQSAGYGIDVGSSQSVAYISSGYNQRLDFKTDPSSGPVERMSILANGNVGIGTTSPSNRLAVNSGTTDVVADFVSSDANAWIQIKDSSTTDTAVMVGAVGDDMRLRAGSNERVRITSTGDVGIGTTSPASPLHVYKATHTELITESVGDYFPSTSIKRTGGSSKTNYHWQFQIGSTGFLNFKDRTNNYYPIILNASGDVLLGSDTSGQNSRMFVDQSTGNVGIGTTSPSRLLHVQSNDSTTSATVDLLRLTTLSTGTTTTGFGPEIRFQAERNDGIMQNTGSIASAAEVNSGSNISSALVFNTGTVGVLDEKMRISYDGKVGIGTNSPGRTLVVSGGSSLSGSIGIDGAATGNQQIAFAQGGSDKAYLTYWDSSDTLALTDGSASGLHFSPSTGRVGIGTSSPAEVLHVAGNIRLNNNQEFRTTDTGGTTRTIMRVDSSDRLQYGWSGNGAVAFMGGGSYTERMRIHTNGNIGIGITTPATALNLKHTGVTGFRIETDGDDDANFIHFKTSSSSSQGYVGNESSTAGANFTGTTARAFVVGASSSGTNTQFISAGTVKATLTSGGRLGVGTSSPRYELSVQGNSTTAIGIALDNTSGSGTADLAILGANYTSHQAGPGEVWLYSPDNINIGGATGNTGNIKFLADNSVNMFIQGSDGKVGIGTTSPGKQLTINGTDAEVLINRTGSYADTINMGMPSGVPTIVGGTDLAFGGTGTWTEHMRIKANGNVGIGTTSPSYKFDVYGTDDVTMRIHRPSSGLAATDTCGIGFSHRGDGSTSTSDTRAGIFSTYNGTLFLATEPGGNLNSNPMDHAALTILGSNQNVGIGTSDPGLKFHVKDTSTTGGILLTRESSNAGAYLGVKFQHSPSDSSYYAEMLFRQVDTNHGGQIEFWTDNSSGTAQQRMTINKSGYVGIGETTPKQWLHVREDDSTAFAASSNMWHTVVVSNENTTGTTRAAGLAFELAGYHENAGTGIAAVKNGTASDYGADLVFITRPQSAVAQERMRIDSLGNVGIGISSQNANQKLIIKTVNDTDVSQGLVIERSNASDRGYINYQGGAFRIIATDGDPIRFGHVSAPDRVTIGTSGQITTGSSITTNGAITNNSSGHAYLNLNNGGSHESGVILQKNGTNKWEGPYISSSGDNLKFYSYGDSSVQMTIRDGVNANGGVELRGLGVSDGSAHYGHYGALFFDSTSNYTGSARSWMITNAYTANQFAILYGSSAGQFPVLGTGGGAGTNTSVAFSIQNNGVGRFHGDLSVAGDVAMDNGRGISFAATGNGSGTMSNELFDDYEEGTWTIVLKDGTGNTYSGTYQSRNGRYTKVGRLVHATFELYVGQVDLTANSLSGNQGIRIAGFPYNSNASQFNGGIINNSNGINYTANSSICLAMARNVDEVILRSFLPSTGAGESEITVTQFNNGNRLVYGTIVYEAS